MNFLVKELLQKQQKINRHLRQLLEVQESLIQPCPEIHDNQFLLFVKISHRFQRLNK